MADDTIPAIAFDNQLAYDVIIYDSFDYDDDDDDSQASNTSSNGKSSDQTYFATLTQLGKVPAGTKASLQPIHDSSAFVAESAADSKPIKRMVVMCYDDITSLSIVKDDEDSMSKTFQFISFYLNNTSDPVAVAFTKVLNNLSDDPAGDIDSFFQSQPAYSSCNFEDYMMAMAYSALHPAVPDPSQPQGSSSLKTASQLMGSQWPDGLPDIFVTKFTCTTKDKRLVLTFEVDINTLPFETAQIASNVLSILNGTKMVKAQILFNYAIGLSIFGTRLSILLDALNIPIDNGKTLAVKKPEISIDINPLFKFVVLTIKATFPFNINGKTFDAIASFVIDNEEAAIGVDIKGDNSSLPPPAGIKGLHFDEFGVGMGLFFKPPGFALGLQGKFHIGEPAGGNVISLNDDTFALVCEFVEEAVEPKYAAFSVPQLSLNQVVELFTDANPNIDVPVSFSDLSFHWSDGLMDAVALPDGTLSGGGYGFTAAVDIFSFGFYGEANLDMNTGLTANVEVSPINWNNVFKLIGDGKGYSLKVDKNGNPVPNNFVPVTQAEKDAVAQATSKQIVTPGGPCLIINTLSMPILHLNAQASLFDLANFDIKADINKDGIKFELDYGVLLTTKMVCNLTDFHNLYAELGYFIDHSIPLPSIGGQSLGSIPLKADVDGHLSIATSLSNVVISAGGQFDFEGYHFSFGDFSGAVNISKISDFIGSVVSYIISEAETIFHQLLDIAEHWAQAVANGIITGVDSVGKGLRYAYGKTSQEMANIMKGVGFAADLVGSELRNAYGAASQDVAAIMKAAGYDVKEIGTAIRHAWNCGIDDVSWALNQVGYRAEEVTDALESAFGATAQDVTNTLKKLGYALGDIATNLKDKFKADSIAVANIMKNAGYAVEDIGKGIRAAWNCGMTDVVYALKAVGYTATEAVNALRSAFGAASQDAAAALKAMGYAVEEIGAAIKNSWNCAVNDVTWALQQAGYNAQEIAGALKNAFGDVAQDVANAFKQFGIEAQDVANAVKNVFGRAINDTAAILKQAGYAAKDVASALQSAFNTTVDAVASAMKAVGYAGDEVKDAFEELGGDFKDFADTAWKKFTDPDTWNPSKW